MCQCHNFGPDWWYRGRTHLFDSKGKKHNDVHNGDDYGDGGDDAGDDYGGDHLPQGDEGCTQKEVQSHHHQLLHPRQPLKIITKCHRGKDTSNCLQIVMKIIYFLIGGFLTRLSDFSLVGNIIDHEVLL